MIHTGTMNGELFAEYVFFSLIFKMMEHGHNTIILDNASSHHNAIFKQICLYIGIELIYVPPYSNYLNVVELFFNTLKLYMKKTYGLTLNNMLINIILGHWIYKHWNFTGALRTCGYLGYIFDL